MELSSFIIPFFPDHPWANLAWMVCAAINYMVWLCFLRSWISSKTEMTVQDFLQVAIFLLIGIPVGLLGILGFTVFCICYIADPAPSGLRTRVIWRRKEGT